MILYHGTTLSISEKIDESKALKINSESLYKDPSIQTTPGYIYLSINPALAFYYGNKHSAHYTDPTEEDSFVVYEIELEKEELLVDTDELKYVHEKTKEEINNYNLDKCLKEAYTCKIGRNLEFKKHVKRKLIVPSSTSPENFNESPEFKMKDLKEITESRKDGLKEAIIEKIKNLKWEEL